MLLPDETTDFGRRVRRRLQEETVVWLTTTAADGTPQPNPVWFLAEQQDALLVYNRANAHRLDHVAVRPRIALHFNSDPHGGDVVVLAGVAEQAADVPAADQNAEYLGKYGEQMAAVSGSVEQFARDYSVPLRVRIAKVRGF